MRVPRLLSACLVCVVVIVVWAGGAFSSTRGLTTDCKQLAQARSPAEPRVGPQQRQIMLPAFLPRIGYVCPGPILLREQDPGLHPAYAATFVKGTPYTFNGMTACRCGGGWSVQVNVWQHHVTARVVRALLRHDGKAGTTRSFSAGRFSGTLEVQQLSSSTNAIQSFVWEAGQFTYLFGVRPAEVADPAFSPQKIIASYRPG
jgi:hypothetical protein